MAVPSNLVFWLALLVALAALAGMWKLSRSVRPQPVADAGAGTDDSHAEDLLLRFVVDASGQRRGETVALEGDQVVVKTPEGFLLVGRHQLHSEGATLLLAEDLDWGAARQAGEAWRQRSHKEIAYRPEELPQDSP